MRKCRQTARETLEGGSKAGKGTGRRRQKGVEKDPDQDRRRDQASRCDQRQKASGDHGGLAPGAAVITEVWEVRAPGAPGHGRDGRDLSGPHGGHGWVLEARRRQAPAVEPIGDKEFVQMFLDEAHQCAALAFRTSSRSRSRGGRQPVLRQPPWVRDGPLGGAGGTHVGRSGSGRSAARGLRHRGRNGAPACTARMRPNCPTARRASSTAMCRRRTCFLTYEGFVKVLDFGIAKAEGRRRRPKPARSKASSPMN